MPQQTENHDHLTSYYLISAALFVFLINHIAHFFNFRISFFFDLILYAAVYVSCGQLAKKKKKWGTYMFIVLTIYNLCQLLYYFSAMDSIPFFYTAFIIQLLLQLVAIIYGLKSIKQINENYTLHE